MVRIQKIAADFYILYDGHVRQFLLLGPDKALLLDTGYRDSQVLQTVHTLTDTPVQVLLTHGDIDHAGGLANGVTEAWLHEADWPLVQAPVTLHPLAEGDRFACGRWNLEVIEIPGHTHGSVAFADRALRLLFAGDSVQKDGPIYLFGAHRSVARYIESQHKLAALAADFDRVFPCHHDCPVDPAYIARNLQDAQALQAGRLPSEPVEGMPCRLYRGQWTSFYCTEADRLR